MLTSSLALPLTALLMGLTGGPHCVAMCGAACAAIVSGRSHTAVVQFQTCDATTATTTARTPIQHLLLFHLGRGVGYGALGASAALSVQGIGWLTTFSAALRPVWTLVHICALLLGLMLLWQATQPAWIETAGRRIWAGVRSFSAGRAHLTPFILGACWALLPCGLLYSALMIAALSAHPAQGALVMLLFVLGTSLSMVATNWLWWRLTPSSSGTPSPSGLARWGVRLAGLCLAASALWALWMGYFHNNAPWCSVPPG